MRGEGGAEKREGPEEREGRGSQAPWDRRGRLVH